VEFIICVNTKKLVFLSNTNTIEFPNSESKGTAVIRTSNPATDPFLHILAFEDCCEITAYLLKF